MTNKRNKKIHKEIAEKLVGPPDKEAMEELMYGDESNPYEKYSTGDRDFEFPKDAQPEK